MAPKKKPGRVIGWREFLTLPELTPFPINAKIDTGARTSALHAFDLRVENNNGLRTVVFEIHPLQRSSENAELVTAPLHRFRKVKSSSGQTELRPSIITTAVLGQLSWPIELTLTARDAMGFRMLLGRSALRKRFLVNPSRSYIMSDKPLPKEPTTP
ncbi:MAG: RimK/LysX family protein [Acidimicrobiia bacterium]|nr:RimK/LysX family protein [Acidimicrobiia bacterium]